MHKIIDLHIHSNFSEDADLSVDELFALARKLSISAISITDHDSVQSIEKAIDISQNYAIEYVPGIEITTVFPLDKSQQHILGYFIDNKNTELLDTIGKIAKYRREIAKKRIEALKELNFSLDEDRIFVMAGERPPTAVSIITELLSNADNLNDSRLDVYLNGEKKDNKISNFYRDFLSENGPAYIPFKSISTEAGINIIKKAGGIPVIAHPIQLKNTEWLNIIKEMGISGLEALSTYHKPDDVELYLDFAARNNLLVTAGSDFHGPTSKPKIKPGPQTGGKEMDYSYFKKLKDFHRQNSILH